MSGVNHKLDWETETSPEADPVSTLSTGMDVLDRKFGGGIPAGRIVALSAAPASQSELFLHEMAAVRETVYLTTERTAADVERTLERSDASLDQIEIHELGGDSPLTDARAVVENIEEQTTLIVDPIDPLERRDESEYRAFVNELRTRTTETGGLTVLHCLEGRDVPPQRDRTEYLADIIFELITERRGGSIENSLSIPKSRGWRSLSETIELDLTSDVTIDVSRKIA
ncbi:RAD55 family ATPase [Halobellus ordinarius]|uniref:RAD55 family ATPase n=1 Tax=Halobellus ordinarius TaxID=3075120 RepID=UPI0028800327|nr:transcriptional regulator [Halobellus sp. ZY16]